MGNIKISKFKSFNLKSTEWKAGFLWLVLLSIAIFLYLPILVSNEIIWDDFHFLFHSSRFTDAKSPFEFFGIGGVARSWPASYAGLWTFYQFFGENFLPYKFVNFSIHCFNSYLISLLLNKKPFSKFFVALFLFHPICVEAVGWVMQFGTLSSTCLGLLSIIFFKKSFVIAQNKNLFFALICFLLSLLFKITFILIPFYFILFLVLKKKSSIKNLAYGLFLVFVFFISIWRGVLTINGAVNNKLDQTTSQVYSEEMDMTSGNQNATSFGVDDMRKWKDGYYKPESVNQNILGKTKLVLGNIGAYLNVLVGIEKQQFFYNKESSKSNTSIFLGLFSVALVSGIFFFFRKNHKILLSIACAILLYLPVSGIFYIPFMKFAFIADHWFYPSLALVVCALFFFFETVTLRIQKQNNFNYYKVFCGFVIISFLIFNITKTKKHAEAFSKPELLLKTNIKLNPKNHFLYLILAEQFYKQGDYSLGVKALNGYPSFNIDIANMLLFGNLQLGDTREALRLLEKACEDQIKNGDPSLPLRYLKLALRIDPGAPEVKNMLNLIANKVGPAKLLP